jgi:hypothetical protein
MIDIFLIKLKFSLVGGFIVGLIVGWLSIIAYYVVARIRD